MSKLFRMDIKRRLEALESAGDGLLCFTFEDGTKKYIPAGEAVDFSLKYTGVNIIDISAGEEHGLLPELLMANWQIAKEIGENHD